MPPNLKRWEKLRQKGKAKFIVQNGMLAWGLPMFIFMTFFFARAQHYKMTATLILMQVGIWAVAGAAYGWSIWALNERRYRKFIALRDVIQQT